MNARPLRALLASSAVTVLAGYALIVRPGETALAERDAELDAARATLEQNTALDRRLPVLEREHARAAQQLARLHVGDSRAALVDRFLHALARTAERDAVSVRRIATDPATPGELALTMTIRGPYGNVIRAVRDLNAGDVATRIVLTTLGTADRGPDGRPVLDAAFHVNLLREADDTTIRQSRAV